MAISITLYLTSLFIPFQGFFNFSIHMFPKIPTAKRSKRENLSLWQAVVKAFWSKGGKSKKRGRSKGSQGHYAHVVALMIRRNRKQLKQIKSPKAKYLGMSHTTYHSATVPIAMVLMIFPCQFLCM